MENKATKTTNAYLTFKLGEEIFGAHVKQVLNILTMQRITHVPLAPDYMKGIISLRGQVLPVIDARMKLGLEETAYTASTCIIVIERPEEDAARQAGAIVDDVLSVVDIEPGNVEAPPELANTKQKNIIYGMANSDEGLVMLVDLHKFIDLQTMQQLHEASQV